jgi:hypothetical protein
MNKKSLYVFGMLSLLINATAFAREGTGSSGGGTIVFKKDGTLVITDLLSRDDLVNNLLDADSASHLYGTYHKRFVKQIARKMLLSSSETSGAYEYEGGSKDEDFIKHFNECAGKKLSAFLPLELQSQVATLPSVFLMNVPLPKPSETYSFHLPAQKEVSTTVSEEKQFSVARFYGGHVDLDEALFRTLSPDGQCALVIHEQLRNIDVYSVLKDPLKPAEIEEFTRYVLGFDPRDSALLASARKKIEASSFKEYHKKELDAAKSNIAKLIAMLDTWQRRGADLDSEISIAKAAQGRIEKIAGETHYFQYGAYDHEIGEVQDSIRSIKYASCPSDGYLQLVRDVLNSLSFSSSILSREPESQQVMESLQYQRPEEALLYQNSFGNRPPMFKWFDTLTNKIVTRSIP